MRGSCLRSRESSRLIGPRETVRDAMAYVARSRCSVPTCRGLTPTGRVRFLAKVETICANHTAEERCAKVDSWRNSRQKHRWLAVALLDIEPRLRRVKGFRHLSKLREALRKELGIQSETSCAEKVA